MYRASIGPSGWLLLAIAVPLVVACSQGQSQGDAMSQTAATIAGDELPADLEQLDGFPGSISEGRAPEDDYERPPLAQAKALSEAQTRALLARLEPLPVDPADQQDFALRPTSQPPPKTGTTLQGEFPPAAERERPAAPLPSGPFRVLRYGPEGEVPIAGQISISFDRPMIAVTSHDDSVVGGVPLQLSPAVPGQWRWVGTRTLLFEPRAARLPMATEFQLRLDPQARAADGSAPAESLDWRFATPPPTLQTRLPQGTGVARVPMIVLGFDQRVDAQSLLAHVRLSAAAGSPLPALRLASAEEIDGTDGTSGAWAGLDRERTVFFKPVSPLPTDTAIEVILDAGAPSAEGSRRTESEQRYGFTTYGDFRVIEQRCGWRGECTPNDDFRFRFSNALAPDQDLEALVSIEPEFAGASLNGYGNYLNINGYKPGLRSYRVELSEQLLDVHGQRLSGERVYQFKVGATPAVLMVPGDGLITVDPVGPPRYTFHSVNLAAVQLRVYGVEPAQWTQYLQSANIEWRDNKPLPRKLPGRLLVEQSLTIEGQIEEMVATTLDLQPWLSGALGHLIVELTAQRALGQAQLPDYLQTSAVWLQSTRIGLDAVVDAEHLRAWVTRLEDGRPLVGAQLRLMPAASMAASDSSGVASLQLPPRGNHEDASGRLEAQLGADLAFLPENQHDRSWGEWRRQPRHDDLRWHVFDDRGLYKPGEQVHLKGWLRIIEQRPDGGLALPKATGPLRFTVVDSQNNTLAEGQAAFAGLGGFTLDFQLPDTPNLGQATVRLQLDGVGGFGNAQHQHSFQIQEFRTPEFEVQTSFPSAATVYAGDTLHVRSSAQYYAGGALPGAPVSWTLNATATNYVPPNQSDYSFGIQQLWWRPVMDEGETESIDYSGQTDASGVHELAIALDRYSLPRPLSIGAQSSVQDLNRQAWVSVASTLVHPAANYVGLKTDGYFVERGQPLALDLIVVDLEGQPLADQPVLVEAGRLDWVSRGGEYREVIREPQRCELRSDADGLARCPIDTSIGGQYRITAITTDAQGRRNASRIQRWVSGGRAPPADGVEIEELSFIPDRDQYGPGDTARILIQAPFADGQGLLTLGRHGVLEQRAFGFDGSTHTLEIPIKREWLPNVELAVMVVGSAPRDAERPDGAQRPAQAVGRLNLKLSIAERRLDVAVQPESAALAPGAHTRVDVMVRDAAERPVADAEVALYAVDEAILALGGYQLADPLELYYQLREAGVRLYHLRPTLRLNSDPDMDLIEVEMLHDARVTGSRLQSKAAYVRAPSPPAPMAAPAAEAMMMDAAPQDAGGGEGAPIAVRSDFNPLAVFVPALRTDASGRAQAEFQLPDNLTRYRIMAVAVSGASHYGIGESQLTARLPLMLRPSPPRFLNFGDRFEFPLLLQNQTDEALAVRVALQAVNLRSEGANGYALEVPANDRVELRIPMAADQAGTARYQIAAATSDFADAARGQLPVWTPATTEAFATYGVIDAGAMQQPLALPGAVWPQFGGLSVTTGSTALASLTDAYLYLHQYPFECSEQLASRIMATAALRDVLVAFEVPELASAEAIATQMQRDLDLLQTRQNPNGGFSFWRAGMEEWPFISVHATHALLRARDKGYPPQPAALQRSLSHLKQIERHIPDWYDDRSRGSIIAYALYVRALGGDRDVARARQLVAEAKDLSALSFESLGWLLAVLTTDPAASSEVAQLRRFLGNRSSETAAGASFAVSYSDGAHLVLHSDRRADAIILDALIADQPDSDLIPKLVQGLQAHRTRGRWANTQENVFVLLALDRYFQRYESVTPDFVARTWLGDDYAGEHAFRGRSTDQHQIEVPMAWLAKQDPLGPLLLAKDGPGRLYYRIGLDYAPESLQLAPAQHGFEVQRRFEAIDDPADVQRLDDGRWQIRAGAKVAVEITMIAPARRHHVALVDPLPAGLEVINPDLTPQLDPPGGPKPWWADAGGRGAGMAARGWWWGPWYQHQNLRDNRVEAFTALLPGGVYSYRYEARATTPGEYVVPPAKAEEMYEPETFGRSGTDRVVVR